MHRYIFVIMQKHNCILGGGGTYFVIYILCENVILCWNGYVILTKFLSPAAWEV